MRERPILFSGPMVRAILDGSKTVTRRVVRPAQVEALGLELAALAGRLWPDIDPAPIQTHGLCPYGEPGDRLWVKETFGPASSAVFDRLWVYRADNTSARVEFDACAVWDRIDPIESADRWRPSIFMPRAASRIDLEIVSVRCERLQDIPDADAIAEGCDWGLEMGRCASPVAWYEALWDTINGDRYPWASNPWVWRIEFKRVRP